MPAHVARDLPLLTTQIRTSDGMGLARPGDQMSRRVRERSIRVTVTPAEHEKITALAEAAGRGVGDYLRRLALGDEVEEVDGRVARRLAREAEADVTPRPPTD